MQPSSSGRLSGSGRGTGDEPGTVAVGQQQCPVGARDLGEPALSMWAGQSVALARAPQSAADIVTELTSRL